MTRKDPARGDIVRVDWVDIHEDATGDTDQAALQPRTSYGVFWTRKKDEDTGVPCIVTTTTIDAGGAHQQGYCIYPEACVRKLVVVKRAK